MARYVLDVRYDGATFHGSQVQGDLPTVQKAVNDALSTLLRRPVETFGASRTDEGVHALSNCYHFDAKEPLPPQLQYKLNAIFPEGLSLNDLFHATAADFNARFDATARRYRYRIYHHKDPFLRGRAYFFPYRFDKAILDETAAMLLRHTDYESFCKRGAQAHTYQCRISEAAWTVHGEELHFTVEANRFLRGMVRGLVGTQLRTARRGDAGDFERTILAKDCTKAEFSVPGCGLYLEEVRYPAGSLVPVPDVRPVRKQPANSTTPPGDRLKA